MIALNKPEDHPFSEVKHIAAAIKKTRADGCHVGILYQYGEHPPSFLHLAFHHRLTLEQPMADDSYHWVQCSGFEGDEAIDFAIWISKVWTRNKKRVPYGINYWRGAHFDRSGKYVQSADGAGLTCATFVMALFESYGHALVDIKTWMPRADDADFQRFVAEGLTNPQWVPPDSLQSPDHAQHVQQQIDSIGKAVRFRPEEIAASIGLWHDAPVCFGRAQPAGRDLFRAL